MGQKLNIVVRKIFRMTIVYFSYVSGNSIVTISCEACFGEAPATNQMHPKINKRAIRIALIVNFFTNIPF